MAATLLLHGAGIVIAQLTVLSVACLLGNSAYGQQDSNELQIEDKDIVSLQDMVVTQRADSQVGIADSASQGNVGQEQLKYRPISSSR